MSGDLVERVEKLEEKVENIENQIKHSGSEDLDKKTSLVEYSKRFNPSSHREKVLVIGRYLERDKESENFTSKDIEEGYKKAKWKPPKNPSDVIAKNVRRGDMMEVGSDSEGFKTYTLTQSGEDKLKKMKKSEEK